MTLDLTKPMRWKLDHTPVIVLWSDDNDTFAEWQPPYDEPVRQHMRTEWFSERVENIPPEPPRGPEEVWVSVYHNGFVTWTACASEGAALDMIACANPARAGAAVRYIRADLATRWNVADRLATVIRELLGRTSGNPIRRCHPVWVEAYAVLADYEAQKSTLTKTKGAQQS